MTYSSPDPRPGRRRKSWRPGNRRPRRPLTKARARRWAFVAAIHLVPTIVLWFGLSLAWDRTYFDAPEQGREAVIERMVERWTTSVGANAEYHQRTRTERITAEEYGPPDRRPRAHYPVVSFWTLEGRAEAEVEQPLSVTPALAYADIGDKVPVRYDRRDPGHVLLYTGPATLWLAPGVIIGVGALFNLLCLIASIPLLRR